MRHLNPEQNLYVNLGQSFETPTLNEVLYTPVGLPSCSSNCSANRFAGLDPAKSRQLEFGWKWRRGEEGTITASAFLTRTEDDIVPEFLDTTGSTWQNVDTERKGFEVAGNWRWNKNLSSATSLTLLEATYRGSATIRGNYGSTVTGREKLPNIPAERAQIELRYRSTEMAKKNVPLLEWSLELVSVGEIYVRSNNAEKTSRYSLANFSLIANKPLGQGFVTGHLRIDNLADKLYAASTIGDQAAGRYYEPGAPRNWLLGLKYSIAL